MLRHGTVALLLLLTLMAGPAAASDTPPGEGCPPGYILGPYGCYEDPNQDGGGEDDGDEDGGGGGQTGCAQDSPLVQPAPCAYAGYTFSEAHDAYLRPLDPDQNERYRPPDGDLAWQGYWTGPPDQGWMYQWRKLAQWAPAVWGEYGYVWLAGPPVGPPVVDPEAVAEAILDGMGLEPVQIGMAPKPLEQVGDSIGLVGAPAWMWVENPGPTTWGPITDSGSEGGVTVTVTAQVDDIVWDMGDGASVTCDSPGDAYSQSLGVRESPSCGHTYERTSRDQAGQAYPVTATTNWSAEWEASTGASGTLDVDPLSSSVQVRIGERQLIEQ